MSWPHVGLYRTDPNSTEFRRGDLNLAHERLPITYPDPDNPMMMKTESFGRELLVIEGKSETIAQIREVINSYLAGIREWAEPA